MKLQVYAQKETCSEELHIERLVSTALESISSSSNHKNNISGNPSLQLLWGSTMYHLNDLPFRASNLPDVFTQFRKVRRTTPRVFFVWHTKVSSDIRHKPNALQSVESQSTIRGCVKTPVSLGPPPPTITDWGIIPMAEELGVRPDKACNRIHVLSHPLSMMGEIMLILFQPFDILGSQRNGLFWR